MAAVTYARTSALANCGTEKDSFKRQVQACKRCAASMGYKIQKEFWDKGVAGTKNVHERPAFNDMVDFMLQHKVMVILVEEQSRIARDVMVCEVTHKTLAELGFKLVAAATPDVFTIDSPSHVLIRQLLAAVSEFERSSMAFTLDHRLAGVMHVYSYPKLKFFVGKSCPITWRLCL